MMRPASRQSLPALLVVGVLSWGLAGCGSDSSGSSDAAATPTQSAACADEEALKSSLTALEDVDVRQDGVDALTGAIADVKTDLTAAASSASAEVQPQVQAVTTAFDALQAATAGLTTDNVVSQAPAIATALQGLKTATTDLATAISQSCPEG